MQAVVGEGEGEKEGGRIKRRSERKRGRGGKQKKGEEEGKKRERERCKSFLSLSSLRSNKQHWLKLFSAYTESPPRVGCLEWPLRVSPAHSLHGRPQGTQVQPGLQHTQVCSLYISPSLFLFLPLPLPLSLPSPSISASLSFSFPFSTMVSFI